RDGLARFEGYYANPEAEAERTRAGWYWTGDLGYRDEDGIFYFAGRNADWLRVDGENFAAAPVERILSRFPGVVAVAVFPVPDPSTGDQVMAAVEMSRDRDLDLTELADFLGAQPDLGTKWAPRFVRLVEQLPTTASGKTDKQPLRSHPWSTSDPLWWRREPRGLVYERFNDDERAALHQAFVEHGRDTLDGIESSC
ncbi:MAG: hypothetical protein WKF43_13925, partial [Acidimicrobiales bacterium]